MALTHLALQRIDCVIGAAGGLRCGACGYQISASNQPGGTLSAGMGQQVGSQRRASAYPRLVAYAESAHDDVAKALQIKQLPYD